MASEREIIYLAALLHDIGKFWQKADGFWNSKNSLSEEAKNLKGYATKMSMWGDVPTHQHVYWTFQFIQNHKSDFDLCGIPTEGKDGLSNLATFHHRPQSFLQGLITLADRWASGIDRYEENDKDDDKKDSENLPTSDIKWGALKYKKMPLAKIFNRLLVNNKKPKRLDSEQEVYDLEPLSLKPELIIGRKLGKDPEILTENYREHWESFQDEFKKLPKTGFTEFSTTLSFLLRKYMWCSPADTTTLFDNSLYEHLKVTAAIALCLYDYYVEHPNAFKADNKNRLSLSDTHYPIRLWCVDLSGIQKFIYDISSKSAAKSLKGRSFYLQLLLDAIAHRLIDDSEIKATISNIIYSSGGKFFLLLPNTTLVNNKVHKIFKEIRKNLWEEYQGTIYVCLGSVAWKYANNASNQDSTKGWKIAVDGEKSLVTLGDLWSKAIQSASEQKSQKLYDILLDKGNFSRLFGGQYDKGGENKLCAVTGIEYGQDKLTNIGDEVIISRSVKKQIEIGEELRNFKFLVRGNSGIEISNDLHRVKFLDHLRNVDNGHVSLVPESPDLNFLPETASSKRCSFGFQWYGGAQVPVLDIQGKKVRNFEELSGVFRRDRDSNKSEIVNTEGKYNRLAYLRMDVDDLGKLFTQGFEKSLASFSAYSTLSASLDWFFSGYLNIIRSKDKYKDWVNIIYSGGDDLFAVGRWDKIISFAYEIRKEFRNFVGRDDISISGGLSIVGPRFPIYNSALLAGEAEDAAKEFIRIHEGGRKKNALCIFGIPIGWEEFENVEKWKRRIVDWLREDKLSKGMLHKIFEYYESGYLKNKQSWRWHAAYMFARHVKGTLDERNRTSLNQLKNVIFTESDDGKRFRFDALVVACRWAELEDRDKS